ncbi:MAG: hypothetical protein WCZ48_08450, partial [Bacillota bacterium]
TLTTVDPNISSCTNLPSGTLSGTNITERRPAEEANPASDDAALQVDEQLTTDAPCSRALATATPDARSFSGPVGFCPSSFTTTSLTPTFARKQLPVPPHGSIAVHGKPPIESAAVHGIVVIDHVKHSIACRT